MFTLERSGKCFIFTSNMYIKKGHSGLLFIFNFNVGMICWHVAYLENSGRLLNVLVRRTKQAYYQHTAVSNGV